MEILKSYKILASLLWASYFYFAFVLLKASLGNRTSKTMFQRTTGMAYANEIPKIIHQLWNDKFVPNPVISHIKTWTNKHPEWSYWFWTKELQHKFITEKYPFYLTIYENYKLDIEKSDMIRILILFEFGGVYADLDMEVLKPLDDIIAGKPCLMAASTPEVATIFLQTNETSIINNALIACRPGHPLLKLVLNSFRKSKSRTGQDVMLSTGPLFLHSVVKNYIGINSGGSVVELEGRSDVLHIDTNTTLNDVYIAQSEYFLPNFAPIHSVIMKKRCRRILTDKATGSQKHSTLLDERKISICLSLEKANYERNPSSRSYTVHHWMGSWIPDTGWVDAHKNRTLARDTDHVNIDTIFDVRSTNILIG